MSASLNLEAYLEHDLIVSDFSVDHMAARLLHLEPFDVAKILAAVSYTHLTLPTKA